MKTKKQVFDLAKELNIEIEHSDYGITLDTEMWTSKGVVFSSTGCHCSVYNEFKAGQKKGEHWQAVYDDIKEGLEPCENSECDTCH